MGELSKLPNIGKEVESQLNKVGIFTYDELKDIGTEQAWLKIQEIDASACIHRLLALEQSLGAIKAASQFGGSEFVTMIDPAGHPFCLCAKDNKC